MAITFSRHRIRYRIDQATPNNLINEYTGLEATLYRSRAWQFDLGVFYDGELCSIANLSSITVEIKSLNTDGSVHADSAPLASKTLAAGSMDDTVTSADWDAKLKQHASVEFDIAETGIDMTGASSNVRRLGIIVTAVTTAAQRLTLGEGFISLKEDGGITSANTPAAGDPTYLTADEVRALVASYVPVLGQPGGSITLVNDQGVGIILYAENGTATPSLKQDIVS